MLPKLIELPVGPIMPPHPESDERENLSLASVLGALRRRKLLILACMVFTNVVVAGVLWLVPEQYSSSASLMVEAADAHAISGKPVARGIPPWMPNDNTVMVTQVSLLRTRDVAEQVVRKLNLADDPEFRSLTAKMK